MDPDSNEKLSDLEETYRAFDGSRSDAPSTRQFSTAPKTEHRAETTAGRGPEGGSTHPDGRSGEDDAIPTSPEGYLFDKYRMLHKLGGGGMGFVWLVEHVALEQQRALKVIRSEVADDPVNLDRFRREARILAKLSRHPNAVQVYDTGFVGKFAYIEMDYLEGQTLKNRLEQDGVMPMADVAWFLGELCAVLGEAHALGIVHRDIKPQNIMIVPDRLHRAGRAGQGPRFRHRQDRPGRRGRHGRHDPAHRGLPGDLPLLQPGAARAPAARAEGGRRGRPPQRHLHGGRDALRDARRHPPVRGNPDQDPLRSRPHAPAPVRRVRSRGRHPRGGRGRRPSLPGERPRTPAPVGARAVGELPGGSRSDPVRRRSDDVGPRAGFADRNSPPSRSRGRRSRRESRPPCRAASGRSSAPSPPRPPASAC